MAEIEVPVRTVQIKYRCDQCDDSYMEYTGAKDGRFSYPVMFIHKCPTCQCVKSLPTIYPKVEYRNDRQPAS